MKSQPTALTFASFERSGSWSKTGRGMADATAFLANFEAVIKTADASLREVSVKHRDRLSGKEQTAA